MLDKIVVLCNTSGIKILLIMYKIIGFATIQAIALLVALNFGMGWLFSGIGFCFLVEYCYFAPYDVNASIEDYEERRADSRKMIFVHAAWFCCTIIIATFLGVLNGYDFYMEIPVGDSFEYEKVHQEGYWWFLVLMIPVRVAVQRFIEDQLDRNKKLFKDRNYPKAV